MPVDFIIADKSYKPELLSASEAFNGNVMGKFLADFTIHVGWYTDVNECEVYRAPAYNAGGGLFDFQEADQGIRVKGVDLDNEGFSVGDRVVFKADFEYRGLSGNTKIRVSGIIKSINNDIIYLDDYSEEIIPTPNSGPLAKQLIQEDFDNWNGDFPGFFGDYEDFNLKGARLIGDATELSSLIFTPALIENSTKKIVNEITSEEPRYICKDGANRQGDIGILSNNLVFSGVNKANNIVDYARVAADGDGKTLDFYIPDRKPLYAAFNIRYSMPIYLYHLDGGEIYEKFFAGEKSIKPVFKAEFRSNYSDASTAKILEFTNEVGNTGNLNENFNGGVNDFKVESLTYENEFGKLNLGDPTTVKARIKTTGTFQSTKPFGVAISCLPTEEQYLYNETYKWSELWGYDFRLESTGTATGNFPSIIKSIGSNIVDSKTLDLEIVIDYNQGAGTIVKELYDVGDSYRLALLIDNGNQNPSQSTLVTLLLDENTFEKATDIPGLLEIDENTGLTYTPLDRLGFTLDGSNGKYNTIQVFNEDVINFNFKFKTNLVKRARIESILFKIWAYTFEDDQEPFELYSRPIPTNSFIIVGGAQKIDYNNTAGILIAESDFNVIKFKSTNVEGGGNSYVTPSGQVVYPNGEPKQNYEGTVSFRIPWQDWQENLNVPGLFYDNSKLNNNLNNKSSNYSNKRDYFICAGLDVVMSQDSNQTLYRLLGSGTWKGETQGNIVDKDPNTSVSGIWVKNYEEPFIANFWSSIVYNTFDSSDNDLSGIILQGETTKFVVTFNSLVDLTTLNEDAFNIAVRVEDSGQAGNALDEYNSIVGYRQNTAFSDVTFEIFADKFVITGFVDYETQANLSARVYLNDLALAPSTGSFSDDFSDDFDI